MKSGENWVGFYGSQGQLGTTAQDRSIAIYVIQNKCFEKYVLNFLVYEIAS
jgi:hypothetical protein